VSIREPLILPGLVPPRPRFLGLRLAYWEFREYLDVYAVLTRSWSYAAHRAATIRWTIHNYDQPVRCNCGEAGTVRVQCHPSPTGHSGDMPPWWWRCAEHSRIPLEVAWAGNRPLIGQTREECSWNQAKTDGPITICGCGTHVGEPGSSWKRDR
jgi:hypothetical protein